MRTCALLLLSAVLVAVAAAPAAGQGPSAMEQKLVAMKLSDLEAMAAWGWWGRADNAYRDLEAAVKLKNITNPVILDRLGKVKAALDDHVKQAAGRGEDARVAAFLDRVAKANNRFRIDQAKVIHVRPDGRGDARTIAEALARSESGDVLELYTGTFTLSTVDLRAKGDRNRDRARVFYAAPGHWPRVVAAEDQAFTIEEPVFADGLEIWPGKRGISDRPLNVSNCYFRSPTPPPALDKGATGLTGRDRRAATTDSVFRNLLLAVEPNRDMETDRCLFITCVTAFAAEGNNNAKARECVFYRCVNATTGQRASAERCLFARVRNRHDGNGKLDEKDCDSGDDPFRDPFKNDYRLKSTLAILKNGPVGPRWGDERWEMLAANFDLSADQAPQSLAVLRSPEAEARLAEARAAAEAKDWNKAAVALADLLGPLADCPAVASRDVEQLASDILKEATAAGAAPRAGQDPAARKQADDLHAQAAAHAQAGRHPEAIDAAKKAVAADDTHVAAIQLLADLLMETGHPVQAEPLLQRCGHLIAANADQVPLKVRTEQNTLENKLASRMLASQSWQKLVDEFTAKYEEKSEAPGLPSGAMVARRMLLLTGDQKKWRKKLDDAESALVAPLKDPLANGSAERAENLRAEGMRALNDRLYPKAIELYTDAWAEQPMPEDLLKLAQCQQRMGRPSVAAILAVMVRQAAAGLSDRVRSATLERSAIDVLRPIDPLVLAVEQLDRQFLSGADQRRKGAVVKNDLDTVAAIDAILKKLQSIDNAAIRRQMPKPPGE